jgi:hypothetical protein
MNKYDLKIEKNALKIYINDILHISIKRSSILGYQSWINAPAGMYFIEYTTDGREILTEYDDVEKWKSILKLLNKASIFPSY